MFLHDFCDGKMSADVPFWKNSCPARSGSETLACKSCAQASRIVRVVWLPCRRRRSPIIFRWENQVFSNITCFLHFCKVVCCCFDVAILMRRWCCSGGYFSVHAVNACTSCAQTRSAKYIHVYTHLHIYPHRYTPVQKRPWPLNSILSALARRPSPKPQCRTRTKFIVPL